MTSAPALGGIPVIPWAQYVALYDGCHPTLPQCVLDHEGVVLYLPLTATVAQLSAALAHFHQPSGADAPRLCFVADVPLTALAAWYVALPLVEDTP